MAPQRGRQSGGQPGKKGGDGHGKRTRSRDRRRERKRNENGQFADAVEAADVLSVFEAVEGPVVTSTDVGDVLGISTETARQRLNDLVTDGTLRRRKTGRTIVYWHVGESGGVGDS